MRELIIVSGMLLSGASLVVAIAMAGIAFGKKRDLRETIRNLLRSQGIQLPSVGTALNPERFEMSVEGYLAIAREHNALADSPEIESEWRGIQRQELLATLGVLVGILSFVVVLYFRH